MTACEAYPLFPRSRASSSSFLLFAVQRSGLPRSCGLRSADGIRSTSGCRNQNGPSSASGFSQRNFRGMTVQALKGRHGLVGGIQYCNVEERQRRQLPSAYRNNWGALRNASSVLHEDSHLWPDAQSSLTSPFCDFLFLAGLVGRDLAIVSGFGLSRDFM